MRALPLCLENGNHGQPSIAAAVAEYLEETRIGKKPRTFAACSTALGYFVESCPKIFAPFCATKKQQAPRSVYNKFESVMTFLKANGIRGLVGKNDWPRYVEEKPEIYSKAELKTFLSAVTPRRNCGLNSSS